MPPVCESQNVTVSMRGDVSNLERYCSTGYLVEIHNPETLIGSNLQFVSAAFIKRHRMTLRESKPGTVTGMAEMLTVCADI